MPHPNDIRIPHVMYRYVMRQAVEEKGAKTEEEEARATHCATVNSHQDKAVGCLI